MTSDSKTPSWSRARKLLWPVEKSEYKTFIPMLLIYALIVFNYTILRGAKDALVITAHGSGASVIPYIKTWAVIPMTFLSTLIFTRLSNKLTRERVFNAMTIGFITFFVLFAFVLYPVRDFIHPHATADYLQSLCPIGLKGLIAVFRNWSFTLFYVLCDLWSPIIMTVLFWGFANDVTSVGDAKRHYAILGLGANVGKVIAAQIGVFLSGDYIFHKFSFAGGDKWGQVLMLTTGLVFIVGVITMILYGKLNKDAQVGQEKPFEVKKKIKMGIRENFAYLAKSKYLICIALLVLTYNISINLVEVVWKDQVHMLYPDPSDYNIYMNKIQSYLGILATIFSVFFCGQVIRKSGWTVGAYLTPVIMFITGILFFSFIILKDFGPVASFAALLGSTPLMVATFLGSIQNCLARASKFTFFDVTKEMAFIPLSEESKLKGKTAIDGVGSRLGKSGGSLLLQGLLVFFGTITLATPFVGVLLFGVVIVWLFSVRSLGKQFSKDEAKSKEKIDSSSTALHEVTT